MAAPEFQSPSAQRRWQRFTQQHTAPAWHFFTAHLAFPVALTPHLAQKLWLNCRQDETGAPLGLPPSAAGLLLNSTLFQRMSYGQYELYEGLRDPLLFWLGQSPHYGPDRLMRLARFMKAYLQYCPAQVPSAVFREAQDWNADAWLSPHRAAARILEALSETVLTGKGQNRVGLMLSWAKSQEALAEKGGVEAAPLAVVRQLAEGISRLQTEDEAGAKAALEQIQPYIREGRSGRAEALRARVPKAVLDLLRPAEPQPQDVSVTLEQVAIYLNCLPPHEARAAELRADRELQEAGVVWAGQEVEADYTLHFTQAHFYLSPSLNPYQPLTAVWPIATNRLSARPVLWQVARVAELRQQPAESEWPLGFRFSYQKEPLRVEEGVISVADYLDEEPEILLEVENFGEIQLYFIVWAIDQRFGVTGYTAPAEASSRGSKMAPAVSAETGSLQPGQSEVLRIPIEFEAYKRAFNWAVSEIHLKVMAAAEPFDQVHRLEEPLPAPGQPEDTGRGAWAAKVAGSSAGSHSAACVADFRVLVANLDENRLSAQQLMALLQAPELEPFGRALFFEARGLEPNYRLREAFQVLRDLPPRKGNDWADQLIEEGRYDPPYFHWLRLLREQLEAHVAEGAPPAGSAVIALGETWLNPAEASEGILSELRRQRPVFSAPLREWTDVAEAAKVLPQGLPFQEITFVLSPMAYLLFDHFPNFISKASGSPMELAENLLDTGFVDTINALERQWLAGIVSFLGLDERFRVLILGYDYLPFAPLARQYSPERAGTDEEWALGQQLLDYAVDVVNQRLHTLLQGLEEIAGFVDIRTELRSHSNIYPRLTPEQITAHRRRIEEAIARPSRASTYQASAFYYWQQVLKADRLPLYQEFARRFEKEDDLLALAQRRGKQLSGVAYTPSGKNYLYIIGIGAYESLPGLPYARKDGETIRQILEEKYQFDPSLTTCHYDAEATAQNIISHFEALSKTLSEADTLLVYFSGHSEYEETLDMSYWVPCDAKQGNIGDYISFGLLMRFIRSINSRHTFIISDSCYSSSIFAEMQDSNVKDRPESLASRWLLAAGRSETVSDSGPVQQSPFAQMVIKALEDNYENRLPVSVFCNRVLKAAGNNVNNQLPRGAALRDVGDRGGEFRLRLKDFAYQAVWETPEESAEPKTKQEGASSAGRLESKPKDLPSLKKRLRQDLAKGRFKDAFDLLNACIIDDSHLKTGIIMQQGRYESMTRQRIQGLVEEQSAELTFNRIAYALLQLVDDLEESDIELSTQRSREATVSPSAAPDSIETLALQEQLALLERRLAHFEKALSESTAKAQRTRLEALLRRTQEQVAAIQSRIKA